MPEAKAAEDAAEESPEKTAAPHSAKDGALSRPGSAESPPAAPATKRTVAKKPGRTATAPKRAETETKPAAKEKVLVKKAPRRPTLKPAELRLLGIRRAQDARRPLFVRQATHRYFRIGRYTSWRRPRGLQSKQRRHYGYRPTVVSIGFRSPRLIRGRTPSGFLPILVRTPTEVERIDPLREAALIARTVGTRRRLLLEEVARKRGVHILNPLAKEPREA